MSDSAEARGTIAALHLHPVKSCASLEPTEALLVEKVKKGGVGTS